MHQVFKVGDYDVLVSDPARRTQYGRLCSNKGRFVQRAEGAPSDEYVNRSWTERLSDRRDICAARNSDPFAGP